MELKENEGREAGQVATEEAADFARVAAMVGDIEPQPVQAEQQPQPEGPVMDAAESIAGLLAMCSGVAGFAGLKNVAALWSDEACREFGDKTVPVLRKYPWGARVLAFFETGAGVEEMALGAFVLPMGFATWQAFKADTARPEADKMSASDAPREATTTPGEFREVGRAD